MWLPPVTRPRIGHGQTIRQRPTHLVSPPPAGRRLPLYLQVADSIREVILSGDLGPGDPLPTERELAEEHAVSRASVREALRALQAQGLVEAAGPPTRTVVAPGAVRHARDALITLLRLNAVDVRDLMRFRALVEGAALTDAAHNPDRSWRAEAQDAVDEMVAAADDIERFDRADLRFHMALVRGSGSEVMELVMRVLRESVARHLRGQLEGADDVPTLLARLVDEHRAILDAAVGGDGVRAARLVADHIRNFYEE